MPERVNLIRVRLDSFDGDKAGVPASSLESIVQGSRHNLCPPVCTTKDIDQVVDSGQVNTLS